MHRPLLYNVTRHFVLARVSCWRDYSAVNFNRSTVIFYFFVRLVKIFALKTNTLQIKLQISEK